MPASNQSILESGRGSRSDLVGWLLSVALLAVNLALHDMWFDELQAWGLVCTSRSPMELIGMIEPEGHPPLWYLLLYPLTRWTEDP
ncbi:MAG: hypothetical protein KC800_33705, partial [Candidatus Eremiobacteraeota bacterium]|nr:hypothetical protein [Candidatus Eremiobacteraeota bacterium]